jgi:hypothetical protein
MNPAEDAQRVFGPVDSRFREDGRVQRRQPVLDLERVVPVALEGRLINSAHSSGAIFALTEMQP